jgi:hypothetical protein
VCGHLGPYSHAWLELGEFQIDITADQFVRDPEKELWSGRPRDLRDDVAVWGVPGGITNGPTKS